MSVLAIGIAVGSKGRMSVLPLGIVVGRHALDQTRANRAGRPPTQPSRQGLVFPPIALQEFGEGDWFFPRGTARFFKELFFAQE